MGILFFGRMPTASTNSVLKMSELKARPNLGHASLAKKNVRNLPRTIICFVFSSGNRTNNDKIKNFCEGSVS